MEQTPGCPDARESSPASTPGHASTDSPFTCGHCPKAFRRSEHLRRHEKSHTSPRAYPCLTCGKRFARSDVLLRHEYVHRTIDQADSTKQKQRRACLPCSKARERCTRSEPCNRCSVRSIKCEYRRLGMSKQHGQEDVGDRTANSGGSEECSVIAPSPFENSLAQPSELPSDAIPEISTTAPALSSLNASQDESPKSGNLPPRATTRERYQVSHSARLASPNSWRTEHQSQLIGLVTPSTSAFPPNAGLGNGPDVNWLPTSDDWHTQWTSILELGFGPGVQLSQNRAPGPATHSPTDQAATATDVMDPPTVPSTASGLPGTPSTRGSNRSVDRGRLYATSSSARATVYERDSNQEPFISGAHAQVPITKLLQSNSQRRGTSIQGLTPQDAPDHDSAKLVWPSTYDRLLSEFQKYRASGIQGCSQFADDGFLTLKQLDMVVQLFFSRFLPSLPIFHETLSGANEYWILTLAMATIGCHYTKTEEFDRVVVLLHEFLGSTLRGHADMHREPAMELLYVQAFLLSQIGLTYYGPTEMRQRAALYHGILIRRAENLGLFSSLPGHFYATDSAESSQSSMALDSTTRWHIWVKQETARRLGYSIWIIDIMGSYHFGARSFLPSQLPLGDLPHDGLWAAPSEHEWSLIVGRTERNPPLASAVRRLFVDREIKPDLGEFSRIIVLHGLYHEIQQVKTYFQRPLSMWVPTAPGSSGHHSPHDQASPGLAGKETYSAWRNSSLDCVDVLHWWANGVIALHSGMEHTTVLHLHMSRIVLLVPMHEILILVQSMTSRARGVPLEISAADVHKAESEVLRWAHKDESKARLTVIHSGVVWWHLRRFSAAAFYEPQSVYLATLTLWAYSYYVSRPSRASGTVLADEDDDSGSESSSEPGFIWIDRPNDDEMVQFFVRKGRPDRVKAFVAGVGDIFEPQGPAKILKEGLRIIEKIAFPWGRESEYVRTLHIASRAMSSAQEGVHAHPRLE